MSKWPWPQRLKRITRSSPACLAASASSNDRADRVRGLGRRDDPLGAGEPDRRLEGRRLRVRPRLDHALLDERADDRRVAVVAQAAGVDRRRHEVVAERVHRHQRGQPDRVAEVVAVGAPGQGRAGGRLGGDEAGRAGRRGASRGRTGRRSRRSWSRRRRSRSTTSGYSPAISICAIASWPITVWCRQTWLSTEPSE